MAKSKYRSALTEIGVTEAQYIKIVGFFQRNGIDFGWVPKGFRFCLWGTGIDDYPVLTTWCGTATVRGYLDEPQRVFSDFAARVEQLRGHAMATAEAGE
jgi:hypothetical protein